MEPTVPLFREFFYLNDQMEWVNGASLELGRVTIQRRLECGFPAVTLPSHPKGWGKTRFYCKNTACANENPLLGFREERLQMDFQLPDSLTAKEHATLTFSWPKLRALNANGLTGVDLIRCWVEWRIMPLSRRGLMCKYDGDLNNAYHLSNIMLDSHEVNSIVKKLCGESRDMCSKTGLNPFCIQNPSSEVNIFNHNSSYLFFTSLRTCFLIHIVVESLALLETENRENKCQKGQSRPKEEKEEQSTCWRVIWYGRVTCCQKPI